ncbi:MAG: hypothetical protein GY850_24235, partial [bacterium]|nr:hypothetical protein [bacterium]
MIQNKKTNVFVMNGGESKASDIFEDLFKAGFLTEEEKEKLHEILDPFYKTLYKRGDSEEYWEEVREFWAFKEPSENGVVMMNAANLCPEPEPLIEMANYLRTIYNEDVSMQVRTGGGRYVLGLEKSREIIGKALGLEGEKLKNLAIVRNASEANNTISSAYHNWNPNGTDKVVIWEGNHPTNRDVWHMRSKWDGQKMRENPLFQIVEVEFGREADADEIADKFIKEIDDNT